MKQIKKIFKLIITIACIIYLVRFFYTNRDSLQIAFNLNILTIIYIVVLSVIYLLLYSYRFQLIIEKCSGCRLPFLGWFKISILGRFLNIVFSQMGNIYRGIRLKKDYNISYTKYISSFTSFAWLDTCTNMTVATVVVIVFNPNLKIGQFNAWLILLGLTVFIASVPFVAEMLFHKINPKQPYLAWAHSKLSEVLVATVSNLNNMAYLLKIIMLGLVVIVPTVLAYYILFRSFEIHLGLPALMVFHVLLKLSVFVNITPGNIGVQEIAYGFISEQMGIGMAQGILVSVVARILSTGTILLLGLLLGGFDLLRHRKDYSELNK